jgi:hypothetical protein
MKKDTNEKIILQFISKKKRGSTGGRSRVGVLKTLINQ